MRIGVFDSETSALAWSFRCVGNSELVDTYYSAGCRQKYYPTLKFYSLNFKYYCKFQNVVRCYTLRTEQSEPLVFVIVSRDKRDGSRDYVLHRLSKQISARVGFVTILR